MVLLNDNAVDYFKDNIGCFYETDNDKEKLLYAISIIGALDFSIATNDIDCAVVNTTIDDYFSLYKNNNKIEDNKQ